MKRQGGIIIGLLAIAIGISVTLGDGGKVEAAACSNVSSFGAVSLQVPDLPNDGEVRVWLRMQAPLSKATVKIEVNDQDCYDIRATGLSDSSWTWQTYAGLDDIKTIKFDETTGNNIKVIGITDGVKVDKVLFTAKDCIPKEFGDNCIDATAAQQNGKDSIIQLSPPPNGPITGEYILTKTPYDYVYQLSSLRYVADGKTVQESDSPVEFDTTRVDNGKHTILIETELSSGKVIKESIVVEVKNPLNPFSPLIRWSKVNYNSFKTILLITGSIVGALILYGLMRTAYMKHRERKFHGF